MRIGFASDHRGLKLKKELMEYFKDKYELVDVGTYTEESCDYPDYAKALGDLILENKVDFGVAICGSGIGISIACNKIKGIYCAKVSNAKEAEYTRNDNNTNVIAFGETMDLEEAKRAVLTFINTPYSNLEKHNRRIAKVKEIENA
jgi:ribose 5-phosphate isomerase B